MLYPKLLIHAFVRLLFWLVDSFVVGAIYSKFQVDKNVTQLYAFYDPSDGINRVTNAEIATDGKYLSKINPFNWSETQALTDLSSYDGFYINQWGSAMTSFSYINETTNTVEYRVAIGMGPKTSNLNKTNGQNMFIYIIDPILDTIVKGQTNFEATTNMYITDLYAANIKSNLNLNSSSKECFSNYNNNYNSNSKTNKNSNTNNGIILIGLLEYIDDNSLKIVTIDSETGDMIDILFEMNNNTILSKYNLPGKSAFSSNNCKFDILRFDKYTKSLLIDIDLKNNNFTMFEESDHGNLYYSPAIWYSNIAENNNDDDYNGEDKFLALRGNSGSFKLSSIDEILMKNGSLEFNTICQIKFNTKNGDIAVYGSGKSPFAFDKDYLFYLGLTQNLYQIAWTVQININDNATDSVCINGATSEAITNYQTLFAMNAPICPT